MKLTTLTSAALLMILLWPISSAKAFDYDCDDEQIFGTSLDALMQSALDQGDFRATDDGNLTLWFSADESNRRSLHDDFELPLLEVAEADPDGEPLDALAGVMTHQAFRDLSAPSRWFVVVVWTADDEIDQDGDYLVSIDTDDGETIGLRFDASSEELDEAAIDEWLSSAVVELSLDPPSAIHEEACCIIRQRQPCEDALRNVVEESCRGRVFASLPRATVTVSDSLPAGGSLVAARVEFPYADTEFEPLRGPAGGEIEVADGGSYRQNMLMPGAQFSQPISVIRPEVCLQAIRISSTDTEPTAVGEAHCRTLELPASDAEWRIGERIGGDECQAYAVEDVFTGYAPRVARETNCVDEGTGLCTQLPTEPEWPAVPEDEFSDESPDSSTDENSDSADTTDTGDHANAESNGNSGCSAAGGHGGTGAFGFLLLGLVALRRSRRQVP